MFTRPRRHGVNDRRGKVRMKKDSSSELAKKIFEKRREISFLELLVQYHRALEVSNPRYSLRALAQRTGVAASTLSRILRGKVKPSSQTVSRIGKKIGLTSEQISILLMRENVVAKKKRLQPFTKLRVQEGVYGHQRAVLGALVRMPGFRSELSWIAGKMNVSVDKVAEIRDRMLKDGLLSIREDGTWEYPPAVRIVHQPRQEDVIKEMISILQTALARGDKIEEFGPVRMRYWTMAVNSDRLFEARAMITEFCHELTSFLQTGELDQICQLSVGVVPLTKKLK